MVRTSGSGGDSGQRDTRPIFRSVTFRFVRFRYGSDVVRMWFDSIRVWFESIQMWFDGFGSGVVRFDSIRFGCGSGNRRGNDGMGCESTNKLLHPCDPSNQSTRSARSTVYRRHAWLIANPSEKKIHYAGESRIAGLLKDKEQAPHTTPKRGKNVTSSARLRTDENEMIDGHEHVYSRRTSENGKE